MVRDSFPVRTYPVALIDTHCHLTFPEFSDRITETLSEAAQAGVDGLISISTTTHDAQRVLEIAAKHARIWCSAGVHPLYAEKGPHVWPDLGRVIAHAKCVAWGELGLDNHYTKPPKAIQRSVLDEQLAYIESKRKQGVDKPIILHCREAFAELIPILRATSIPGDRFVFHCFTGTPADMKRLLDFGAMVSFTGVVTYKNAPEVREAMLMVPSDRIMVETDAPYLAPEPCRTVRPCKPAFARITAEAMAAYRGVPWPDFHRQINQNTHRFYGIMSSDT